jgi:YD repeat-containing protein
VTTASDQRGVTHKYVYDAAGRLSADEATTLGDSTQNVDDTARAIVTAYDDGSGKSARSGKGARVGACTPSAATGRASSVWCST